MNAFLASLLADSFASSATAKPDGTKTKRARIAAPPAPAAPAPMM